MKHEVKIKQVEVASTYQTPDMVVWSMAAEQGFAVSNPNADTSELPGLDQENGWS